MDAKHYNGSDARDTLSAEHVEPCEDCERYPCACPASRCVPCWDNAGELVESVGLGWDMTPCCRACLSEQDNWEPTNEADL